MNKIGLNLKFFGEKCSSLKFERYFSYYKHRMVDYGWLFWLKVASQNYFFLQFFRINKSPPLKSIGFASSTKSCSAKLSFSSHFFWINFSSFGSTWLLLAHSAKEISGHSITGHGVSGHLSKSGFSGHSGSGQLTSGHVISRNSRLFLMLRLTCLLQRSEIQSSDRVLEFYK